jgi:hypothetical protein
MVTNIESSTKRNGYWLKSNMDSDTFTNINIHNRFFDEFFGKELSYKELIESKNLGIICVDVITDHYRIIDAKKWALNKIKYGF